MGLIITLPPSYKNERTWIMNTLFEEFLGLDYVIRFTSEMKHVEIFLDNGRKLTIKDSFFGSFPEESSYLTKGSIPEKIEWINSPFFPEGNYPILFGDNFLEITDNEINCGVDVFASVFFMLSRWEEYVVEERDIHGRFPAVSSLAYKSDFLHRPIVNEAVEFLWSCLQFLGCTQARKARVFNIIPTHDIDKIREKYVIPRRMKKFISKGKLDLRRNPFDTYHYLMDLSEKGGWKSCFYFMGCGKEKIPYDSRYNPQDHLVRRRMKEIIERGHIVGFHPGYHTYRNIERLQREKMEVEKNDIPPVTMGRQHYLRFAVPYTWRDWEEAGLLEDQSLGYADHDGFRCGTGDRFRVYDCLERRELNLYERPLIVMDGTLTGRNYKRGDSSAVAETLRYYRGIAKKYNISLTVLYHNTYFEGHPGILPLYTNFIVSGI